jgi:hypothetical protein
MEKPECELGYTEEQIARIMGDRLDEFNKWMRGQTGAICTGQQYNYETKEYVQTEDAAHGYITYAWDVERFLDGKPVID